MEKKRRWTEVEDAVLFHCVKEKGERDWNAIAIATGLDRSGKSCRLRWLDHLKPNLKKGPITPQEEQLIFQLHAKMGNKWAKIATHLPGRSDNEIKNFWNCKMKKSPPARVPLNPTPAPVLDPPTMAKLQTYQCSQDNIPPPRPPLAVTDQFCVPQILADHFDLGATRTAMQSFTQSMQRIGIPIPNSVLSLVYSSPAPATLMPSNPPLELDDSDLSMELDEIMALLASPPPPNPAPDPIPAPAPAPVPGAAPTTLMPSISSDDSPLELDDSDLSMELNELMALLASAPAPDPIPASAPAPSAVPVVAPAPSAVPVVAPAISWESPLELDPPWELELLNMDFDVEETMAFFDSLPDDVIQELPSVQY